MESRPYRDGLPINMTGVTTGVIGTAADAIAAAITTAIATTAGAIMAAVTVTTDIAGVGEPASVSPITATIAT